MLEEAENVQGAANKSLKLSLAGKILYRELDNNEDRGKRRRILSQEERTELASGFVLHSETLQSVLRRSSSRLSLLQALRPPFYSDESTHVCTKSRIASPPEHCSKFNDELPSRAQGHAARTIKMRYKCALRQRINHIATRIPERHNYF